MVISDLQSLYLIPTPISGSDTSWLSDTDKEEIRSLRLFFVENERTARRFLSLLSFSCPISDITIVRFDKDSTESDANRLINMMDRGISAGILSEAGVPCIADPGALLVRIAHSKTIRVKPLIGPSSIILALMASGLNGQNFIFHGYPPTDISQFKSWLQKCESDSLKTGYTHLWIETPYRSNRTISLLKSYLHDTTLISIAVDIGGNKESIRTYTGKDLRVISYENIDKLPAVFSLLVNRI